MWSRVELKTQAIIMLTVRIFLILVIVLVTHFLQTKRI